MVTSMFRQLGRLTTGGAAGRSTAARRENQHVWRHHKVPELLLHRGETSGHRTD